MDTEALAEARQRAQEALSRARLATDASMKKHWLELADTWLAKIAELEKIAPADAGSKSRRLLRD
jgi:hypothetical protein